MLGVLFKIRGARAFTMTWGKVPNGPEVLMRCWTAGLALLGVFGCRGPEEVTEIVPYIVDELDVPEPSEDPAVLEAVVQEAIVRALSVDAWPVVEVYRTITESRDEYCPYWFGNEEVANWYGECSAESGSWFYGQGGHQTGVEDGQWYDSVYLAGSIITPDGHTFDGGGSAVLSSGSSEEGTYAYSAVSGSFAWDGPGAEGTWLDNGGASLELQVSWQQAIWGQAVSLNGAIDLTERSVSFTDVLFFSEGCPEEPGGVISVRGADGWYDVQFDLDLSGDMNPMDCDGCGTVWYRGVEVGEVCVDVADISSFEEVPW